VLEEGKAVVVAGAEAGCFGASSASIVARHRQKYVEAKEDNFIVNINNKEYCVSIFDKIYKTDLRRSQL